MSTVSDKTIQVSKLDLDLSNYRLDIEARSQAEALEMLMESYGDSIVGLARDIRNRGELSPIDPILVLPVGNRFVVLEGNRRLCALRLLHKPALAPEKYRATFERMSKKFEPIRSVRAKVVSDLESAYEWIELKHKGQGNGEGTVSWGANAKRNFMARSQGRVTYIQAVDSALREWYADDAEFQQMLDSVRHGDHLTNFERILQDRYVREQLGIEWAEGFLTVSYQPSDLKQFFARVLFSLTTPRAEGQPAWSRAWAKASDRKNWFDEQGDCIPGYGQKLGTPLRHEGKVPSRDQSSSESEAKPKPATKKKPRKRSEVTLDTLGFEVHDSYPLAVRKLYDELSDIDYESFPNMTIDALRTFIEKVIKSYAVLQESRVVNTDRNGNERSAQFGHCLGWIKEHCESYASLKGHIVTINALNTKAGKWPRPAEYFNGSNHNQQFLADATMVREAWNASHSLLQDLLKRGPAAPAD